MRINFIALFVVLLIGTAIAQAAKPEPAAPAADCSSSNPIINYLKANKVKFFKDANFDSEKCGGEWENYGGCCDVNSLLRFSQIDKDNINKLHTSGKHQASKIKKYIYYYRVVIGVSFNALRKRASEDKGLTSAQKLKIISQLNEARLTYFKDIISTTKWIRGNTRKIMQNQRTCLNTIAELRSNSACYACSGRAHVFFTKGMLNVNENECRATIADCSGAWTGIFTLIWQISKFNIQVRSLRKALGVDFSSMMVKEATTVLLDWSNQLALATNLASCQDGLCDFPIAKSICESLLSYDKPIYLEQVLNMVRNDMSSSNVELNKQVRQAMVDKAVEYFNKMKTQDFIDTLHKLNFFIPSSINSKGQDSKHKPNPHNAPKPSAHKKGRKLLLKKPPTPPAAPTPSAPVQPVLQPVIDAAVDLVQNTIQNPLLCAQSAAICVAEKVIQTITDCSSGLIQCTTPSLSFP